MSKRILEDWLNSYLELTTFTEPPEMFRTWVAVSVMAAAMQRKCRLRWGSLTFYPNMYTVLVGPPGKARKGTAMKVGRDFLMDLGVKMAAESITREALVRELQECSDSLIYSDKGIMETHSSLTVYSEELIVFLGHQNYQLMADLTDWYDCANQWIYRTKGSGTDNIIGVWVNMLGATTPDLIRTALPLDAIGGGLTSRMIFVFEPRKGHLEPFPQWGREQIVLRKKLMDDLERIYSLKGEFKIHKEFIDPWTEWYYQQDRHPPFEDTRFAGYIERRPTHLLKLCMILSASRSDSMEISPEDFERALALLERTEIKMPQAFTGVGKNTQSDILTKVWTDLALSKDMTFGQILSKYHVDADQRTLEAIIKTLSEMKIIRISYQGKTTHLTYVGNADNPLDRAISASVAEETK